MGKNSVEIGRSAAARLVYVGVVLMFGNLFLAPAALAQFKTAWEISEPAAAGQAKPHEQSAMFATVDSSITLYAYVYQSEGYPLPDDRAPTAKLKAKPIGSDRPYQVFAITEVPSLGARASAKIQFQIATRSPGGRLYKVCLSGVLDENAREVPEICGRERVMYTRRPSQDIWSVSSISIHPPRAGETSVVQEYEWLSVEFTVENIAPQYGRNNPEGFSLRYRQAGETGGGREQYAGTYHNLRQYIDGREVFRPGFGELARGVYEIRACAHNERVVPGAPIDWVCGPWTTVVVEAAAPVQPVTPKQPQSGGKSADGKACTDRKRRKADGTCCPTGQIARLNRCVRQKAAKSGQVQKNPLTCIGGKVRGKLCWCGIGKFPRKVRGNTFKCR